MIFSADHFPAAFGFNSLSRISGHGPALACDLFVLRKGFRLFGLWNFCCTIFSYTWLPSDSNFRFKSDQYLLGIELPVNTSTTSMTEKYHLSFSSSQWRRILFPWKFATWVKTVSFVIRIPLSCFLFVAWGMAATPWPYCWRQQYGPKYPAWNLNRLTLQRPCSIAKQFRASLLRLRSRGLTLLKINGMRNL